MALNNQMDMFKEENDMSLDNREDMFKESDMELMQEGGDTDPISGNEVPPGGTQEGVRDDIEANISEGEMVIPEDVVRYFGVDHFMKLRDEAKMGYKKMAAMGQMGNPDEASIPEDSMFNSGDMPFSVIDLEYVDDEGDDEAGDEPQFAVGGLATVNPSTQETVPNTSFLQPTQTKNFDVNEAGVPSQVRIQPFPNTDFATPGRIRTKSSGVDSTLTGIAADPKTSLPVAGTTSPTDTGLLPKLPDFGTLTGGVSSFNFFRNEDGDIVQVPVINGRQIFDEPEGYQRFDPDKPTDNLFDPDKEVVEDKPEEQEDKPEEQEEFDGLSGDEVGPDTGPPDSEGAGGLVDAINSMFGISPDATSEASNAPGNVAAGEAAAETATETQAESEAAQATAANAAAISAAVSEAANIGETVSQADMDNAAETQAESEAAQATAANAAADAATGSQADVAADADGPSDKVICTELTSKGLLDKDVYKLESEYADKYISEQTMRGYHLWAVPLVKLMRKSTLVTNCVKPFATAWANEVAHSYKPNLYKKGTLFGKIVIAVGVPICTALGWFVSTSNYRVLYEKENVHGN